MASVGITSDSWPCQASPVSRFGNLALPCPELVNLSDRVTWRSSEPAFFRALLAGRGTWRTDQNPGRCAAGHTHSRCSGWQSPYRWPFKWSHQAGATPENSSLLESRSPVRPSARPSTSFGRAFEDKVRDRAAKSPSLADLLMYRLATTRSTSNFCLESVFVPSTF